MGITECPRLIRIDNNSLLYHILYETCILLLATILTKAQHAYIHTTHLSTASFCSLVYSGSPVVCSCSLLSVLTFLAEWSRELPCPIPLGRLSSLFSVANISVTMRAINVGVICFI